MNSNQKGFTLMELLVTVIILAVLVTMAIPMYERAIEKSHRAEVSVTLARLEEAKMRTMSNMELTEFSASPQSFNANHLDGTFQQDSSHFRYSLYPNSTYPNAVCAERTGGPHVGTTFLYLGESASECNCDTAGATTPCGRFCAGTEHLFCKDNVAGDCEAYGMDSVNFGDCAIVF